MLPSATVSPVTALKWALHEPWWGRGQPRRRLSATPPCVLSGPSDTVFHASSVAQLAFAWLPCGLPVAFLWPSCSLPVASRWGRYCGPSRGYLAGLVAALQTAWPARRRASKLLKNLTKGA
jgi:hypothetical protein